MLVHRTQPDHVVGRHTGQSGRGEVVAEVEHPQLRLDVGQQFEHQIVAGEGEGLQGGVLVRGEDHSRVELTGPDLGDVGDGEAAGGDRCGARIPGRLRAEEDQVALDADLHIGGHVDRDERVLPHLRFGREAAVVGSDVVEIEEAGSGVEEVDGVDDDGSIRGLRPGPDIAADEDGDMVAGHLGDDRGLGDRLSALEHSGLAGIGRGGQGVLVGLGRHDHGVVVEPGQLRLGGGKVEAAVDEALVLEVEFADPARVSPVGRQLDERATVVAAADHRTRPDPPCVLNGGEFVEVEQDFPVGCRCAVAVPGGASPQPFRVRLVPPEVVVAVSAFGNHRDPVIGVQSGAQFAGERVEEFVAEAVQGLRVLVLDPGDLLFAGDVLEPEILVFGLLARRRGCCAGSFFTHATHPSVCRPGIRPLPPVTDWPEAETLIEPTGRSVDIIGLQRTSAVFDGVRAETDVLSTSPAGDRPLCLGRRSFPDAGWLVFPAAGWRPLTTDVRGAC